ncbi:MAG: hypothetical protein A2580_13360 [Hydrogenophilales bacterium RIFOXYD1_FULL_62_11]|nr:MAG: hypothetical protein A2580_13360 [Hydrogenophilales bacterium RIFOXYD1_FULL_62_11]
MYEYSEADEACEGDQSKALSNLRHQVVMRESAGVIAMYELAALKCGARWDQIDPCYKGFRNS